MMQGGLTAISQGQTMLGNNLLRKRLAGDVGPPFEGVSRCLFGPPDAKVCRDMVKKLESKNAWAFSRRWNFDITHNGVRTLESSTEEQQPLKFEWSEVYTEDQMTKSDRHRYETPIAPNARPVPLLFAPVCELVPNLDVNYSSPAIENVAESVAIQTEEKEQVDQETQVEADEITLNCQMTISQIFPTPVSDTSFDCEKDQKYECPESTPNARKERRLPEPLTILPISPEQELEEHFEDSDEPDHCDDALSPLHNMNRQQIYSSSQPSVSPSDSHETPIRRRNTIAGVFTFPPTFGEASSGLQCLIRNGSPVRPHSTVTRNFKQRSITDYLQHVKKSKVTKVKKLQ